MFHQRVSEICVEETFVATAATAVAAARAGFGRRPTDADQSHGPVECLATGDLAAVAEALCIREMQAHVDRSSEIVVGGGIEIDHRHPVVSGTALHARGWVEQIGECSARFLVSLSDADAVVCEARITLMAVQRPAPPARIAARSGVAVESRGAAACNQREADDALARTWRHRTDPTPQSARSVRSAFQRSVFSSRAASSAK